MSFAGDARGPPCAFSVSAVTCAPLRAVAPCPLLVHGPPPQECAEIFNSEEICEAVEMLTNCHCRHFTAEDLVRQGPAHPLAARATTLLSRLRSVG